MLPVPQWLADMRDDPNNHVHMSQQASRFARKLNLAEQMKDVKSRFVKLFKAFDAMAKATGEELDARPTKTEVAYMIGQAIEQATGKKVVHAIAEPVTVERALSLVPDDIKAAAAIFVADDEDQGEGPE